MNEKKRDIILDTFSLKQNRTKKSNNNKTKQKIKQKSSGAKFTFIISKNYNNLTLMDATM